MKDNKAQTILETNVSGPLREKAIISELEKQIQDLIEKNLRLQTALTESDDRYQQLIKSSPTDITDVKIARKNLQESEALQTKNHELKRSEDQYHRMIAEIQDYVIILLDQEGNIQNWNKGAESIKGYTAKEAIGKNFSMFYSEGDRKSGLPQQLIQIAAEKGKANHEGWRIRKDGTKFWGNIVITAIHDDNDNIVGYSKVTRDLTERKKADELLKSNADKMREKNRELEAMNQELASFAYVSSHDLQEPLRKIQTFASRIVEMEEDKLSPKGKDYFQRMQNAALRMQTLIEDLLAYSRTNTAEQKFERSDLNKLLEEVKNELKETIEEKKVQIKADKLPALNVISFQIRQLFTNILSNAIKFSKEGISPVIRISVEKLKRPDIEHANPDINYFHIAFADNGIGFDPEHRTKIFEVFQRLHGRSEYTGTGIGLAICKKIMDNHHGFITADSESEKGATFHVYLPEEKSN